MKRATFVVASGVLVLMSAAATAAPIEYVKVCDMYGAGFFYVPDARVGLLGRATEAYFPDLDGDGQSDTDDKGLVQAMPPFGGGFFYIPGTNTCLRVGGFAKVDLETWDDSGSSGTFFGAKVHPTIDARTETQYGTLRTYVSWNLGAFTETWSGGSDSWTEARVHRAFIQVAGWTFGKTSSNFDNQPGYTLSYPFQSDANVWQLRASHVRGPYTTEISVERPEDRHIDGDFPALVFSLAPTNTWGYRASFAVTGTEHGLGAAAQIGSEFAAGPGLTVRANAAVAFNAPDYVGLYGSSPGLAASTQVSARQQLARDVDLVGAVGFALYDGDFEYALSGGIHFTPGNWKFAAEAFYRGETGGFQEVGALLRAQYKFTPAQ